MRFIKLEGLPQEIGYHHGKDGREGIRDFLKIVLEHSQESIPNLTREEAFDRARRYIPSIKAYAPHLAKEIEGIAEGAGISIEEAYLLQVRAELTQLTIEQETDKGGCTSFTVHKDRTEDGEVWVGQNLDLSPSYKDFGVMLHIAPEKGPKILCYSQIGTVSHAGINSTGMGLVVNALYSSGWKFGIPRPILYRLILEKESVFEAMKVVTQAGRASSCNYLLSHKSGKVKDIETTPDHYGVIDLEGDIMVHANHFVHFDMIPFEKRPKDKLENSKFRENRFKQLVTGGKGKLSLEKLKECLTDHEHYPRAVCAHAEGNPWNIATIASIIAQPSNGLMHVSYGQGCKNEYVTYSL